MRSPWLILVATTIVCLTAYAAAYAADEPRVLDDRLHHLRIDGPREWSEFPLAPEGDSLELKFDSAPNAAQQTLRLRQQDVKQTWRVLLNGQELGRLRRDENDMVVYFPLPAGSLIAGENVLRIEQDQRRGKVTDDIRVGEIALASRAVRDVLSEATVQIEVVDADTGRHLPSRITILDNRGALHTTGAASNDHLAVRPGIVYTSRGKARFGLPAGRYTIYAGRGFEYSLDRVDVTLVAGDTTRRTLSIRREVPTIGYVACDTHVHTLTHSGHGDASVEERMVTIAAEGIELPIATDHNTHIDHAPLAQAMNVRRYFTPVIGNEVTTTVGHFNVFPVKAGAKIPDYKLTDWPSIFDDIFRTPNVKAVILNHGRDLHGGTRPLGPKWHNGLIGQNLIGWQLRANAMEVINSGATQTDPMRLLHDWMGLLNRGRMITPVGSSDSHDVGRHFVGQGRTYIRCDDKDPGNIDVDQAVNNFVQGRVMVSYGLLAELTVDGKYGPGELVPVANDHVRVDIRVLGPHWVTASELELYANGKKVWETSIPTDDQADLPRGVKWSGHWELPRPKHDVYLTAVARGPGVDGLYWKTAKAYQPTSEKWTARVVGSSGAVWLDVDGDGRKTPAYDYARRLVAAAGGDPRALIASLADYDEAVAAQAADIYQSSGKSLLTLDVLAAMDKASPATRAGIAAYLRASRASQVARDAE